jgi:hypothetical protein
VVGKSGDRQGLAQVVTEDTHLRRQTAVRCPQEIRFGRERGIGHPLGQDDLEAPLAHVLVDNIVGQQRETRCADREVA